MSNSTKTTFPFSIARVRLEGVLAARTGLHIGGSEVGMQVGGADNVVVRDPRTGRPYVPGSSLKGKIRSLLERAGYAKNLHIEPKDKGFEARPCQCGELDCVVCQLFGVAADSRRAYVPGKKWTGVARLIVRDAHLTQHSAEDIETWRYLDVPFGEIKTEVAIDRLTSKANPRNFERVPAGAEFAFEMIVDVRQGDDENALLDLLLKGLELLAADFLGGHGTRGYGAVQVRLERAERLDVARARQGGGQLVWQPLHAVAGVSLPWVRPQVGSTTTDDTEQGAAAS